jgi:DNA-binding transcriptional ArsR family regulator
MKHKTISLSAKEDLKIYMSPQRQQLLRVMRIEGHPVTAKRIADVLGISASSASHHISKLAGLGVIEEDHTEIINGILARYYRLADVTVNIGLQLDDGLEGERNAVTQNILLSTLRGMSKGIERAKRSGIPPDRLHEYGDVLSGAIHLTPEDSQKLLTMIRGFIEAHKQKQQGTEPWEFALILYNSGFMQ